MDDIEQSDHMLNVAATLTRKPSIAALFPYTWVISALMRNSQPRYVETAAHLRRLLASKGASRTKAKLVVEKSKRFVDRHSRELQACVGKSGMPQFVLDFILSCEYIDPAREEYRPIENEHELALYLHYNK